MVIDLFFKHEKQKAPPSSKCWSTELRQRVSLLFQSRRCLHHLYHFLWHIKIP